MPWPITGANKCYVRLELPDKGRSIKVLIVCNSSDLEPLYLLNSLALGYHQPYEDSEYSPLKILIKSWGRVFYLSANFGKVFPVKTINTIDYEY